MTGGYDPILVEGRLIQQEYDRGLTWTRIAVEFDTTVPTAQRLAKRYRDYCQREADEQQLPLFHVA